MHITHILAVEGTFETVCGKMYESKTYNSESTALCGDCWVETIRTIKQETLDSAYQDHK